MTRTLEDSLLWMRQGTELFLGCANSLTDPELDQSSDLPGWTRRTLVAHVAANADAIGNLIHWAASGDETPMYVSPESRAAGIEQGSRLPADELLAWLGESAARLAAAMSSLTDAQWSHPVLTAQGRTVPASEAPWMRSREVMVHSVDLAADVHFPDLPRGFLSSLREDITAKRGDLPEVVGDLADVTAWLAGRRHDNVTTATGEIAPALGPWL